MSRYRRMTFKGRKNRRLFSRTARKVHKKNIIKHISRGGIRL